MAVFTIQIIAFNLPVWDDPISLFEYAVGDNVDYDLYNLLNENINNTVITRKPGTDQLPPDLAIHDGRYLQGTITEVADRTFRLIATRDGVAIESPDIRILTTAAVTATDALWTSLDRPIWTTGGQPIWSR